MVCGASPPQVGGGVVSRTTQVELSKVQSEAADVLARGDGVGAARLNVQIFSKLEKCHLS